MPRIPRPSPATLIAFAALFIALGGPSQAAQLARKVTHHHSLRGPRGPKGSFAKPFLLTARVDESGRGVVQCPPRSIPTGGGVIANQGQFVNASEPNTPQGWFGAVITSSGAPGGGNVSVLCVPTS